MDAELWKRIEELFRAAMAQPPEKRVAFLDQACPDDPQLRDEVQSLVDAASGDSSFLERGPLSSGSAPGPSLGHFQILGLLGRGGMGAVYRARDSRLERDVAIKVLPASFARDPGRIARFEREARAACALNHPNIVSVYDIGRGSGTYWIVSELVEGETLRRAIERGPLPARKTAGIAAQIAEGLAAAQAAGIVHRDLKPANIMLASGGRVKILDFGLAKRDSPASDPSGRKLTDEGTVMGTVGYMSPEQVRGEDVDYRSDIFSFGAVLYEMLAGKQAFARASSIEQMNAILKDEPPDLPSSVLPGLERIVRRCLEKDKARRFPSASDLGFALASVSESQPASAWAPTGLYARRTIVGVVLGVAVLAALAWLVIHRGLRAAGAPASMTQRRLTFRSSENPVQAAAISPNGEYLAYSDPAGIHVKLLSTGEERVISRPAGVPASALWKVDSWFPDGVRLLVDAVQPGGSAGMWTVSLLGQSPQQLREGASGFGVSPDGKHIAFAPYAAQTNDIREIWLMDIQGDNAQKLFAVGEHDRLNSIHWSPDGQRLAFTRYQPRSDGFRGSIETCDLSGVKRTLVLAGDDVWVDDFRWLPEGRIVYERPESLGATPPAYSGSGSDGNLWQIGIDNNSGAPEGEPKRITQWAGSYLWGLDASADGKRLILRKGIYQGQVYLGELSMGGTRMSPPRRLTDDESYDSPTAWTPDAKAVLFLSNRNGTPGIFKQGITQTTSEAVVTGQDVSYPRLSADGAWVLYMEAPGTSADPASPDRLMRVPVNGGAPQLIMETRNWNDFWCARSPKNLCVIGEESTDRKQLRFTEFDTLHGRGKVLRSIGIDGSHLYTEMALAPDGSMLAVSPGGEREIHIRLLSLAGGSDREITVKGWPNMAGLDWVPDGTGIYCGSVSPKGSTLLHVDLQGNARVLWQYNGGGTEIGGVPSSDGRYLAVGRAVTNSNVWMVEGF